MCQIVECGCPSYGCSRWPWGQRAGAGRTTCASSRSRRATGTMMATGSARSFFGYLVFPSQLSWFFPPILFLIGQLLFVGFMLCCSINQLLLWFANMYVMYVICKIYPSDPSCTENNLHFPAARRMSRGRLLCNSSCRLQRWGSLGGQEEETGWKQIFAMLSIVMIIVFG